GRGRSLRRGGRRAGRRGPGRGPWRESGTSPLLYRGRAGPRLDSSPLSRLCGRGEKNRSSARPAASVSTAKSTAAPHSTALGHRYVRRQKRNTGRVSTLTSSGRNRL